MRTKSEVQETKKVVNEFNLQEAFVLWKNTAKTGKDYLKGYTPTYQDGSKTNLVGYFNTNKKNPKEPDIRVYALVDCEQDIEVASLWENISEKTEKRYLTGSTNDNEKLVGWYGKDDKKPYLRVYYKEN